MRLVIASYWEKARIIGQKGFRFLLCNQTWIKLHVWFEKLWPFCLKPDGKRKKLIQLQRFFLIFLSCQVKLFSFNFKAIFIWIQFLNLQRLSNIKFSIDLKQESWVYKSKRKIKFIIKLNGSLLTNLRQKKAKLKHLSLIEILSHKSQNQFLYSFVLIENDQSSDCIQNRFFWNKSSYPIILFNIIAVQLNHTWNDVYQIEVFFYMLSFNIIDSNLSIHLSLPFNFTHSLDDCKIFKLRLWIEFIW